MNTKTREVFFGSPVNNRELMKTLFERKIVDTYCCRKKIVFVLFFLPLFFVFFECDGGGGQRDDFS